MGRMGEDAEKIMAERFGKDSIIALATVEDGMPYVRWVNAYYEDGAFYIITHALSNKVRQAERGPVVGIAERLRRAFSEWIDNGHNDFDDENTIILCVELTDGVLLSHGTRYEFQLSA